MHTPFSLTDKALRRQQGGARFGRVEWNGGGGRAEAVGAATPAVTAITPNAKKKSIPGPIFATVETVRSHVDGLPLWDSHPG